MISDMQQYIMKKYIRERQATQTWSSTIFPAECSEEGTDCDMDSGFGMQRSCLSMGMEIE